MSAVLRVEGLACGYGETRILSGLSLDVARHVRTVLGGDQRPHLGLGGVAGGDDDAGDAIGDGLVNVGAIEIHHAPQ